uniref:Putative secreted protein n=1 Tax=Ixodes ricinus TaxID=34613 RepID=A0A6B0TR43_IXORI
MYWFSQRKLESFFFLLRLTLGLLWFLSQGQCELLLELQEAGHFLLDGRLVCLGCLELPHLVSLLERVF